MHPEVEGAGGFGEDAHRPRFMQSPQLYPCGCQGNPVAHEPPCECVGHPPALSHVSMWGRHCRELMDNTLAWAQVKGNWKCRRSGWGPEALKEMKEVSGQLAPVGGGKGPVPFAPLSGNMVPIVVLFYIANPDSGPVIPGVGKGKVKGGGVIQTLQTLPQRLQWGRGRGRRRVRGRGRGR